jgi:glycosyltransferase involved in cell wall biosynthesis
LRSYEYLAPKSVYGKMLEMDVFLLTVVPQGKGDQISGYTSPLKLYEYLAAGRPVLVSDLPVLREDVSDKAVYFCANTVEHFAQTLLRIDANRLDARSRAVAGLAVAHVRTWALRSRRILELCQVI